ncbi:MAG: thioesterase family protein [Nocardioides sp.]|nr:thioesterase family protein [Nocardioides sp.]
MSNQPSYEELAPLPAYAQQPVPTPFEDANGYLNVRHYLGIGSEGLDDSLTELGIEWNWPTKEGRACLSAEHYIRYLDGLRSGDRMSVRVRLVGRSERAAHAVVYVLDDTHERLACVFEEIFLHVLVEERRTAPWPDVVATAMDARIAEQAALPWEPGLSGMLALR